MTKMATPDEKVEKVFLSKYYKQLEELPIERLQLLNKLESILALLNVIGVALMITIFLLITQRGITVSTVIIITKDIWQSSIRISYYLCWIFLIIIFLNISIKLRMNKFMKIPPALRQKLKREQLLGDEKFISEPHIVEKESEDDGRRMGDENMHGDKSETAADKSEEDNYGEMDRYLRNSRTFIQVSIFTAITVLGYLNYFPRGTSLFASYYEDPSIDPNLGFILKTPQYFTFYIFNILFLIVIISEFIFLMGASLRRIKDFHRIIDKRIYLEFEKAREERDKYEAESAKSKKKIEAPWKIPIPKPWDLMTLEERRAHKLEELKRKREYYEKVRLERLVLEIMEEKEKLRMGKRRYRKLKKNLKKHKKLIELKKTGESPAKKILYPKVPVISEHSGSALGRTKKEKDRKKVSEDKYDFR